MYLKVFVEPNFFPFFFSFGLCREGLKPLLGHFCCLTYWEMSSLFSVTETKEEHKGIFLFKTLSLENRVPYGQNFEQQRTHFECPLTFFAGDVGQEANYLH